MMPKLKYIPQQDFDRIVESLQQELVTIAKNEGWERSKLALALVDIPKQVRKRMRLDWDLVRGYWDGEA